MADGPVPKETKPSDLRRTLRSVTALVSCGQPTGWKKRGVPDGTARLRAEHGVKPRIAPRAHPAKGFGPSLERKLKRWGKDGTDEGFNVHFCHRDAHFCHLPATVHEDIGVRISTRMSAALAAAGFVVFGLYGVNHLESELETRRGANERNLILAGRSLQLGIENALRDRQMEDIRETMQVLRRIDPSMDIMVWGQSGQVFASSDGSSATDTS